MPIKRKSENQKAAEAEVEEFREDLGPFVVAAETTRMAMVFTNAKAPNNPISFANDSFLRLTGYAREEVLAQDFSFLVEGRDKPEVQMRIKTAYKEASESGDEFRCRRKDGTLFWATIFINPVKDKDGDVIEHFASFIDTTEKKQEVEHLHFLLNELNHRTQNTLTTVLGIAAQTLRSAADKDVIATFEARIMALSTAHSMLGRKDWDQLSLRDLIDEILLPFGPNSPPMSRVEIKGDDVYLPPKAALTFALVFHELATNATKYGALSNNSSGKVDITWQIEAGPAGDLLRLSWQEIGGPPVTAPTRRGFGSRLIETGLAKELDGEVNIEYPPAGMVCRVVMPIPVKGEKS